MPSPLKSPLVTPYELSRSRGSSNVDRHGGNSYAAMSLGGGTNGHSVAPGSEDVSLSHGTHGVLASLSSSKVPASQTVHSDNGVALYIPAEHAETSCIARANRGLLMEPKFPMDSSCPPCATMRRWLVLSSPVAQRRQGHGWLAPSATTSPSPSISPSSISPTASSSSVCRPVIISTWRCSLFFSRMASCAAA